MAVYAKLFLLDNPKKLKFLALYKLQKKNWFYDGIYYHKKHYKEESSDLHPNLHQYP